MSLFFHFQDNFLKEILNTSILIQCRNGISCNGKLKKFDLQMNIFLENPVLTFKKGAFFRETKYIFLRGKLIKYIRII